MAPTPPYILACQQDSHLRELQDVEVVQCRIKEGDDSAFLVQLSDTVLFAEGGGQPADTGVLIPESEDVPQATVSFVERDGDGSVWHTVDHDLPVGTKLTARVDWERRLDHMAQHSGQHLITAVALRSIGYDTGSWNLSKAPQPCYLDLMGPKLTQEQIDQLERDVNAAILADHSVTVRTYTSEQMDSMEDDIRFKERPPNDFPVRVVTIAGLDDNMCCGTHVKNMSELQAIKLLKNDFQKKKDVEFNRLQFVAGPRLLQFTDELASRSNALTAALGVGGDDQVERVNQLQASAKKMQSEMKSLLTDFAQALGPQLLASADDSGLIVYHRKEGTPQFMDTLVKSITAANTEKRDVCIFLTIGDETLRGGGAGAFLLTGTKSGLDEVNKLAIELLNAKGGGKGQRFQGKIPQGSLSTKALKNVKDQIEEHFKAISA
eukprot:CAMPEP_0171494642 /NCGR_PEP_ID=MMETSP0958-20121227/5671_1 /TAXON_ID=87120 /ORGANISM="Aurantiochytrium limacinum, Strain ATCCMYA-1381" /LENGTH=434 /DNA_ID=CAMNT_0012028479 /DNA_START=68 /DNA_END=1372 /DNA_ORIENTATION=+